MAIFFSTVLFFGFIHAFGNVSFFDFLAGNYGVILRNLRLAADIGPSGKSSGQCVRSRSYPSRSF